MRASFTGIFGATATTGACAVPAPTLTAGSVTLSPATVLGVTLNGTTPGDGTGSTYTQTVVNGPVNLGGATLSVSDPGSFTIGQSFVILTSTQPIAGTFAGLPEGGVFTSGQTFEVSYTARIEE